MYICVCIHIHSHHTHVKCEQIVLTRHMCMRCQQIVKICIHICMYMYMYTYTLTTHIHSQHTHMKCEQIVLSHHNHTTCEQIVSTYVLWVYHIKMTCAQSYVYDMWAHMRVSVSHHKNECYNELHNLLTRHQDDLWADSVTHRCDGHVYVSKSTLVTN